MAVNSTSADPATLRRYLEPLAAEGRTLTYQQAASAMSLQPPLTIKRIVNALETLMTEDARAGRHLLAAVVVSRTAPLPAPGFFAHARALGMYDGPESGPEAAAFHAQQRNALTDYYAGAGRQT